MAAAHSAISREFLRELKENHPGVQVDELDLSQTELPPVLDTNVKAKYIMMMGGQLDEQTQASWKKVTEIAEHFTSYDLYLITAPMWNFSIPYMLKHYIDVIMQAGIMFSFTAHGPQGLMKYEKMVCITSRGSDYGPGSPSTASIFRSPTFAPSSAWRALKRSILSELVLQPPIPKKPTSFPRSKDYRYYFEVVWPGADAYAKIHEGPLKP